MDSAERTTAFASEKKKKRNETRKELSQPRTVCAKIKLTRQRSSLENVHTAREPTLDPRVEEKITRVRRRQGHCYKAWPNIKSRGCAQIIDTLLRGLPNYMRQVNKLIR